MIRCCTVLHRGGLQGHDAGSALAGLVGDLVAGEDLGALVYGGFNDGRHQRRATCMLPQCGSMADVGFACLHPAEYCSYYYLLNTR